MAVRKTRKIFVLDTSVLLHDHSAVLHFQDHDVALPITVLEELDTFKKGHDVLQFEARQFIRFLDTLSGGRKLTDWLPLHPDDPKRQGRLKVVLPEPSPAGLPDANHLFGATKNDHHILNAALQLQRENPKDAVILVSKDINLRIKARALNLTAEDYETGKVRNPAGLPAGADRLEDVNATALMQLLAESILDAPKLLGRKVPPGNHYYVLRQGKLNALAFYRRETNQLERLEKISATGIRPRNAEQTFALHALMNPAVKLVTIQGVAGTGKTLLALAGALEQRKEYKQIYLSRPVVALGNKDIGFLPGDAKAKMNPWLEPLWDNLRLIQNQFPENSKEQTRLRELVQHEKLLITPLAYIRGRSLSDIFFIIDEAQNLTPHEVKTIIARAGDNTKIVLTGDIYQIDTPYLDSQSNGLSYLIDRAQNHPLAAHVTLTTGQRSDLANLANELL